MITLSLVENETKEFENSVNQAMEHPIKHFERELLGIRTGRAHAAMVEDIMVEAYGGTSTMKLKALASISVPDARMIMIQPWDPTVMSDIERALRKSELGLSPVNDGNVLRIQLPEMSAERRNELKKVLQKKLEECRIGIRNIRKDFHNLVRDNKNDKRVSEDFSKRLDTLLQKITDKCIEIAQDKATKKEGDLNF